MRHNYYMAVVREAGESADSIGTGLAFKTPALTKESQDLELEIINAVISGNFGNDAQVSIKQVTRKELIGSGGTIRFVDYHQL